MAEVNYTCDSCGCDMYGIPGFCFSCKDRGITEKAPGRHTPPTSPSKNSQKYECMTPEKVMPDTDLEDQEAPKVQIPTAKENPSEVQIQTAEENHKCESCGCDMYAIPGFCFSCRELGLHEKARSSSATSEINVFVDAAIGGERLATVKIGLDKTVLDLSMAVQMATQNQVMKRDILLDGRQLDSSKTLASYNLHDKVVLQAASVETAVNFKQTQGKSPVRVLSERTVPESLQKIKVKSSIESSKHDEKPIFEIAQLLGDGSFKTVKEASPMEIQQLLGDGTFLTLMEPGEESQSKPIAISQLLGDGSFRATAEPEPIEISQLLGDGGFRIAVIPSMVPEDPMQISQLLGDGSFRVTSEPIHMAISQLFGDGSFNTLSVPEVEKDSRPGDGCFTKSQKTSVQGTKIYFAGLCAATLGTFCFLLWRARAKRLTR